MFSHVADYPDIHVPLEGSGPALKKSLYASLLGISIIAADSTRAILSRTEAPYPNRATDTSYYFSGSIPRADTPIPELLDRLSTAQDVHRFLTKHGGTDIPQDPITFMKSYRMTPEEFQANNWKGACSAYANFWCTWAAAHGKKPYLVAMWPKEGTQKEIVGEQKQKRGWHVMAAYKEYSPVRGRDVYVIGNNDLLEHEDDIHDFVERRGFEILPVGGITAWRPEDADAEFRAVLAGQIGFNEEMEVSPSDTFPIGGPITKK